MATIVKGDLYEALDGKLWEIKRQIRQREGYPHDPNRLSRALQAVIEGRFEAVGGLFPSLIYAPDLIPKRWEVAVIDGVPQDVAPSNFRVEDLEFISFLDRGKSSVKGTVMRERAVTLKANFGLSDGKRILAEQDKLPVELRGKYIVLPGTLLCDLDGDLRVACVYWCSERWCLLFRWLASGCNDDYRLARRK